MARQVIWTEEVLRNFERKAMLSEEECFIMESRVKGWTVTQQALHLHKSESSVHRMINKLKKKYDAVYLENPTLFPPRRSSKQEEYMDTH